MRDGDRRVPDAGAQPLGAHSGEPGDPVLRCGCGLELDVVLWLSHAQYVICHMCTHTHICECAIETHVGTHVVHIQKIKIKTKEEAKNGMWLSCEVTGGVWHSFESRDSAGRRNLALLWPHPLAASSDHADEFPPCWWEIRLDWEGCLQSYLSL